MKYLKVESGEVTKTIPNIRKEYSNVSFPGGVPNQEFLDLHSLVKVTPATTTHPNDKVENVDPYKKDDKWYTQKVTPYVNPKTEEPTDEQKWASVRTVRYEKLQMCDYVVLEDSQVSNKDDWKTYRQALRDVPANNADPDDITWPTEPS